MAEPVDSLVVPGREPIWVKPVCCGLSRVGVRGALPVPLAGEAAMPLYLQGGCRRVSVSCSTHTQAHSYAHTQAGA